MAADDGYWASRFDFGKGYPGLSKWLIGQSRAADIVINVLLPFVYAWGKDNGQTRTGGKSLDYFPCLSCGGDKYIGKTYAGAVRVEKHTG